MIFRTLYTESKRFYSNHGSRFVDTYSSKLDERGVIVLEKSDVYDLYDEIQSYKESCDIKSILQRFALGETDVLNKYQSSFIDTTVFPKTYAEFQQNLIDANNMFDSLTAEMKQRFNNSASEFFAEYGSDDWLNKLGLQRKPVENSVDNSIIPPQIDNSITNDNTTLV